MLKADYYRATFDSIKKTTFLTQPPALRGQFLYPDRGQKQTFFDPFPPSSCPHSCWMAPSSLFQGQLCRNLGSMLTAVMIVMSLSPMHQLSCGRFYSLNQVVLQRHGIWASKHQVSVLETCTKNKGMVFCYQNCSDLLWEEIVLVIKKNLQKFWDH